MNERIRELAEQCWDRRLDGLHFDQEQFAELIVQDCISQVALLGISNFDNSDISWTAETAVQNIRKHFGIES